MKNDFIFQNSPWYLLLCLVVGAGYSFFLYNSKNKWSKNINLFLAFLRFAVASFTAFLLLNLMLRLVTQTVEKRSVVIAIDNSQSIKNEAKNSIAAITNKLNELKSKLLSKNIALTIQTLAPEPSTDIDSINFNYPTTNLSQLLGDIKNNYEGRNLTDLILFSDGIYNQGVSPSASKYNFQIHTVALGDTIPKKDIFIKNTFSNKVAYLGNEFPISADIVGNGFAGQTLNVLLRQGSEIIESKKITIINNNSLNTVDFKTTAKVKGLQHYTIDVQQVGGEYSYKNNKKDVYVEVINGKEKILLLALAPHPDIKAIKNIIEKNENFELDVKIIGQYVQGAEVEKKYDLVILHQLPEYFSTGNDLIQKFSKQNVPLFFILANQSSTAQLNNLQDVYKINSGAGQTDKISGIFNPSFKLLNFDATKMELLKKLPLISVPFGEYQLLPNAEIILYQKVGNVPTQKPLFIIGHGSKKTALFLGEGLWQWRMEEFALTEKNEVIDDLILKTIQYLSAKEDNRKLRVYPIASEFIKGEKVIFENEVYNDIYEKISNQKIQLTIQNESGKVTTYNYNNSDAGTRFEISNLTEGVYKYQASALVLGKKEEIKGEFVVKELLLENQTTTADHNLLRQLSDNTGGKFSFLDNADQLINEITKRALPDKIDSTEETKELINMRWLFFLILFLVTVEWVTRKYLGAY